MIKRTYSSDERWREEDWKFWSNLNTEIEVWLESFIIGSAKIFDFLFFEWFITTVALYLSDWKMWVFEWFGVLEDFWNFDLFDELRMQRPYWWFDIENVFYRVAGSFINPLWLGVVRQCASRMTTLTPTPVPLLQPIVMQLKTLRTKYRTGYSFFASVSF